jgi:peptide methionine sulfoxide reductase MsrB
MSKNTTRPVSDRQRETLAQVRWRVGRLDPTRFSILRREAATRGALVGARCSAKSAQGRSPPVALVTPNSSPTTREFDSGSGWPSYHESVNPDAVILQDR